MHAPLLLGFIRYLKLDAETIPRKKSESLDLRPKTGASGIEYPLKYGFNMLPSSEIANPYGLLPTPHPYH